MKYDVEEVKNLAYDDNYKLILKELKLRLFHWQNITQDPWICSPHAVLEDKGPFLNNPQCMLLFN